MNGGFTGVTRGGAYGPSVQVKTWEKPQERTVCSSSARVGMVAGSKDVRVDGMEDGRGVTCFFEIRIWIALCILDQGWMVVVVVLVV